MNASPQQDGLRLIEVSDLTLDYRMARDRAGTIKEFSFQLLRRQVTTEAFRALEGVSFQVGRGEVFAVIGPNGAGKTTLMKCVARVMPPTAGRVVVRGVLAPMIALGAGFNMEQNAYENIVLFGTLLGRDPDHMRDRAEAIGEWAGLTDFMTSPLRTYSSGMLARLGFSVAVDVDPDVLVVDEVLAVGDEVFQRKSYERMRELMDGGAAVLLVSHQLDTVRRLADRVLWLDRGRMRLLGDPERVIDAYKTASA